MDAMDRGSQGLAGPRNSRNTKSSWRSVLSRSIALAAQLQSTPYASQLLDVVGNALTNEAAMNTLHHGFAGNPTRRFLPTTRTGTDPIELTELPGVKDLCAGSISEIATSFATWIRHQEQATCS